MASSANEDVRSSMVRIVDSMSASLPLIALAADVLAADARFNHWIATIGKRKLGDSSMLKLIDLHDEVTSACSSAVDQFELTNDEKTLSDVLDGSLSRLKAALESV